MKRQCLVLCGIDILVMDLPFLHVMLLPKPPSRDLQNALPIVMVFHTILLLTKELTFTATEVWQWALLTESIYFTMFLTILKHLT